MVWEKNRLVANVIKVMGKVIHDCIIFSDIKKLKKKKIQKSILLFYLGTIHVHGKLNFYR